MLQIEADNVDMDAQDRIGAPPEAIQLQRFPAGLDRVGQLDTIELRRLRLAPDGHNDGEQDQSAP